MKSSSNPITPKKLLNSKWTATQPQAKEKHFVVSKVAFDEMGIVTLCEITAVFSQKIYRIDWQQLKQTESWQQGWK